MCKIKILSLSVFLFLLNITIFAQESNDNKETGSQLRKNTFDFTIAGTGLGVSVNYNRIISIKSNYFISASVGIGSVPFVGGTCIPHQLTFNFGKKSSFLEAGLGGTYWHGTENAEPENKIHSYNLLPILGYRQNLANNRMVLRVYASPIIRISGEHFYEDFPVMPYGGVSFGYSF